MRLPPTPCRVCFRPCVFNKFSHFWQKCGASRFPRLAPLPSGYEIEAQRGAAGATQRALARVHMCLLCRA